MSTNLESAVQHYLTAKRLSHRTRDEYLYTVKKWKEWGQPIPLEELGRKEIRDFLDWVYQLAVEQNGRNPGRTPAEPDEHNGGKLCHLPNVRGSRMSLIQA